MKWYNKSHFSRALTDIGMDAKLHKNVENYVIAYSKLALKFMRNQKCEEQVSGVLNLQDVMQICYEGLVAGWNRIDWGKLEKKENWQKSLVNYLSSNIQGNLKRRLYQNATGVNVPESQIRRTKAELEVDRLFGNWMYQFKLDDILSEDAKVIRYIEMIYWDPSSGSDWRTDCLNEDLSNLMFKYLNDFERDIIRKYFGIDHDKMSFVKIANEYDMKEDAVRMRLNRAVKKLNNEEGMRKLKEYL